MMIERIKRSIKEFIRKDPSDIRSIEVVNDDFSVKDLMDLEITFLVTVGRSGTKSLTDYLKKNSNFYVLHAPKPCLATLGSLTWMSEVDKISAQWSYFFAREKYLTESYTRDLVFVDGDCKNLPFLPALATFFPNSKFVHVVRDPVKFVRSGLNRGYYRDKNPIFWGHLYNKNRHGWAKDFEDQVRLICEFWESGNVIAQELKNMVGPERFVTLQSEDFFNNGKCIEKAFKSIGFDKFFGDPGPLPQLNKNKKNESFNEGLILSSVKEFCPSAKTYYPTHFL